MPKKLVLDRTINYVGTGNTRLTIPDGEIWRISILGAGAINGAHIETSSRSGTSEQVSNAIVASGAVVGPSTDGAQFMLTGLAFKLKEV